MAAVFPLLLTCLFSSFDLDAFKRSYSNEDTATKAIPHFWENFESEGWSLWKTEYKYTDELKRTFMSSNLVSGMFQRIEKLRKNAFASMLILGKDNDNRIEGVWVLRGQELAFDVSSFIYGKYGAVCYLVYIGMHEMMVVVVNNINVQIGMYHLSGLYTGIWGMEKRGGVDTPSRGSRTFCDF